MRDLPAPRPNPSRTPETGLLAAILLLADFFPGRRSIWGGRGRGRGERPAHPRQFKSRAAHDQGGRGRGLPGRRQRRRRFRIRRRWSGPSSPSWGTLRRCRACGPIPETAMS